MVVCCACGVRVIEGIGGVLGGGGGNVSCACVSCVSCVCVCVLYAISLLYSCIYNWYLDRDMSDGHLRAVRALRPFPCDVCIRLDKVDVQEAVDGPLGRCRPARDHQLATCGVPSPLVNHITYHINHYNI